MNLVGKILVMLIMVMSLVFMAFAVAVYSTHKNWDEAVNRDPSTVKPGQTAGLKFQLRDLQDKNAKLEEQIRAVQESVNTEWKSREDKMAKLETQKEELKLAKQTLDAQLADLNKKYAEEQNRANLSTAELKDRSAQVAQLRADIEAAQTERDDHFREVVRKTDEFNKASIELQTIKEINDRLAKTLAQAKLTAERAGINLAASPVSLKLDGVVTASNPTSGMIEVSLGSDDGLARGQTLEVHRAGRYLGKVEVLTLWPEKAVAKIIPEYLKGRIERDDRVATRFN